MLKFSTLSHQIPKKKKKKKKRSSIGCAKLKKIKIKMLCSSMLFFYLFYFFYSFSSFSSLLSHVIYVSFAVDFFFLLL